MYTPSEVRQIISDYKWMKNIIDSQVYECDSTSIGQYGIESSMPKAQGTTGDKVLVRVLRNDKDYRKTQSLLDKINFIDNNEEHITNEGTLMIMNFIANSGVSSGSTYVTSTSFSLNAFFTSGHFEQCVVLNMYNLLILLFLHYCHNN